MNVLKPHLQTTILTLLGKGATQREIARITGVSRHTIRAYAQRFAAERPNCPGVATDSVGQTAPPWPPTPVATTVSACEPHRTFIEAQLRLQRNATAIYQDLVDQVAFAGAYNSVKRFAGRLRQKEPEQFDRLSFVPGEEMQVDYGEGAPTLVPGTERYRKPRLFVATLRYSRRSFRRVVWKSSQQTWAELHEQAWRHFGGSCRYVVLDNLKEGVLKPDLYEPKLNAVYTATLAHYGVVADPARVRDPNRKGTVEHAIGHTQATALKGRRFTSIEEQNAFLDHWERTWAATRIHGTERRQVQAMFEEERPLLQPLPVSGMQYFTEAQRTVCDDSCVRVEHCSYAARPAPIGSRVLVRLFARRIEIRDLATQALLRSHARAERPGTVVLPQAERVFNPSRETRRILAQAKAKAIGPDASRLCEMLFAIEGRVGQRKLWGIVSLGERYPKRLIDCACARAITDGLHSYRHVKAITERLVADALAALDAPQQAELALTQEHPLIRSADVYAELFARGAAQTPNPTTPRSFTHDHE
ncbi:Integrase catalytic region [Thiomonas sp. X19]|uniref:IS21 family transposase n=1 Tax=Thiomonas sp. X19 TaxID=1050370 RepID=UPI000B6742F3|nr:IS21 family transposase [Thiomonas sp. X19]SCC93374.1 Integrase catalytic region [Thiomonas sp. X19]